jgi:hypothetical protein
MIPVYHCIEFCQHCSEPQLRDWKGWPLKDRVPILPVLEDGKCPLCGKTDPLYSSQIEWLNKHGPYSTGLPDYWSLIITDRIGNYTQIPRRWGFPYFCIEECPKCGLKMIISQHLQEFVGQCTFCDYFSRIENI